MKFYVQVFLASHLVKLVKGKDLMTKRIEEIFSITYVIYLIL